MDAKQPGKLRLQQLIPFPSMSLARIHSLGLLRRQLTAPFRRSVSTGHGSEHASFPKEGLWPCGLERNAY
jgi:hypothetical protein